MSKSARVDKVSITLPHELLKEIEEIDPEDGMSGFLTRAAQQYLAQERFFQAIRAGFGAWKEENHPDLLTPEDTAAFVRQLRAGDNSSSILMED